MMYLNTADTQRKKIQKFILKYKWKKMAHHHHHHHQAASMAFIVFLVGKKWQPLKWKHQIPNEKQFLVFWEHESSINWTDGCMVRLFLVAVAASFPRWAHTFLQIFITFHVRLRRWHQIYSGPFICAIMMINLGQINR